MVVVDTREPRTDVATISNCSLNATSQCFSVAEALVQALARKRMNGMCCIADENGARTVALPDVRVCVGHAEGEGGDGACLYARDEGREKVCPLRRDATRS